MDMRIVLIVLLCWMCGGCALLRARELDAMGKREVPVIPQAQDVSWATNGSVALSSPNVRLTLRVAGGYEEAFARYRGVFERHGWVFEKPMAGAALLVANR